MADQHELTRLERFLDSLANRHLTRVPAGVREFLVFGIKQAWPVCLGPSCC
ncbi:hypothetical protein BSP239C_00873 [Brevibacterium sp. 239c]|nr:hypothetical protein BSP239C_00873 [Brevibacterium sp. 239c]